MSGPDSANHLETDNDILIAVTPAPPLKGLKQGILLIEHDASVRELFCNAMDYCGIPIWTAGTVAEALDLFHLRGPSIGVVVVDEDLPEWNGPLLWDVLHRLNPHVRGCLIASDATAWTTTDLAKLGIFAAFRKPLQIDEMFQTLERLVTKEIIKVYSPSDLSVS